MFVGTRAGGRCWPVRMVDPGICVLKLVAALASAEKSKASLAAGLF